MRTLFIFLIALFSCTFAQAANENLTTPPKPFPVPVETSLYLWKIENIDEKNQTFSAYLYLDLKWHDPRLAFSGPQDQPKIYSEKALEDEFKEIWWPETDFTNAIDITVHNKSLAVYPDGTLAYSAKISGTFFTPMNFKRFPFDEQIFQIHLQSFLWTADKLQFEIDENQSGFAQDPFLDKFDLRSINAEIQDSLYLGDQYSEYEFSIHLARHSGYYLYQILIPLFIVLGITVAMFFGDISDLSNKLLLGQGCILVLVAMKFMINESLPPIDYLTIIDYVFFVAYLCCGTAVAIACINHRIWKKKMAEHVPFNQHAVWIPVALFAILYLVLFYFIVSRHG